MTHLFPTRRSSDLSNQASLLLHLTGESAWEQDLPRMAQGLLNMQRNGAWRTTTANLLGSLAIEKFSQHYESTPLSGQLRIALAKEGEIQRSEEHTSELQSLMRISYAVFCLK